LAAGFAAYIASESEPMIILGVLRLMVEELESALPACFARSGSAAQVQVHEPDCNQAFCGD
jgi:hypothetical protein